MIIIIGYNNTETFFLNSLFDSRDIEYKYSLLENDITRAEKIILPHPTNFNSTYRRLNLMNLFSLLRIIKVPILGINDGFRLMCNQMINKYKTGLGLLNFDILCSDAAPSQENMTSGRIQILKQNPLLDISFNEFSCNYYVENQPPVNEYTSVKINHNGEEFSLIFENNNYFALAAESSINEDLSREVILNFVNI